MKYSPTATYQTLYTDRRPRTELDLVEAIRNALNPGYAGRTMEDLSRPHCSGARTSLSRGP